MCTAQSAYADPPAPNAVYREENGCRITPIAVSLDRHFYSHAIYFRCVSAANATEPLTSAGGINMADARQDLSKLGFTKTFVLPGLLIFLVPVVSYFFFLHAQSRYDADIRNTVLRRIKEDPGLSPEERGQAIAFFTEHRYSELIADDRFAGQLDETVLFYYATFRWMIRLSGLSILGSVAVLVVAGVCVWLSRKSQHAQYLSLSIGWQVLRIYGALQTIVQGILLLALSFWVTALWFDVYVVKLIFIAGALGLVAVLAVIKAIFHRPNMDFRVEGKVIGREAAPALWEELTAICNKVGTEPPDQVIVGIDDNFFVTEMPVEADGQICQGRTLYVSLSLLKQMHGAESDAVLAHEMAHFSGNDTLYSKKISPLLSRYGVYLQALYENAITRPVFYFMHCFRVLFQLSLSQQSRQREFRADRIAADMTSPRDFASALLRVIAYSQFRGDIQQALFRQEQALSAANICAQIEQGFPDYALTFASSPDVGSLETSHPFDSHPPLSQRLDAVGIPLTTHNGPLLSTPGDGRWYRKIDGAEKIERKQWTQFEERFRAFHEEVLAYRYLPETDEEHELVAKWFPAISIEGKKGSLDMDCETIHYTAWGDSLAFHEITNLTLAENGTLQVHYDRGELLTTLIPMNTFGKLQQEALDTISRYYSRYTAAVAYQTQKQHDAQLATGETV
jgi:Zn-dependent protease with chaperone function